MTTSGAHVWDEPFKAENSFADKIYHFVELTGQDQVDVCDAATDRVIGVLQNDPPAGGAATVRILGISKVKSDGSGTSIGVGDYVGSNGSGEAIKKATADYSVAGMALDPSSADGTIIRVMLLPGAFFRTAAG